MSGKWELVGTLGVDSGQMMLCDPCYVKKDFANEYGEGGNPMSYSGACDATLSNQGFGFLSNKVGDYSINLAFACSSGYGDGEYPVYIKRDGNRIAEMKIVFIGKDHEDEQEDC